MKKIVKGNDFILRIPVTKIVEGEAYEFPLAACETISVSLVSAYKRYTLEHTIEEGSVNVLLANVEGDQMPCGTYALEVKGTLYGNDWRSNEYDQICLVDNNASADTEFDSIEGESSVEMDTQTIVMGMPNPALTPKGEWNETATYHIGDTVSHNCACWWAATVNTDSEPTKGNTDWVVLMDITPFREELEASAKAADEAAENANNAAENATTTEATITANEAKRKEAEGARETSEAARASAETARQEAETKRVEAENKRATAETQRETSTAKTIAEAKTATGNAQTAATKATEAATKVEEMKFKAERNRLLLTI